MRIPLVVTSKLRDGDDWRVVLGIDGGTGWFATVRVDAEEGETVRVGDRYEIALTPGSSVKGDQS